MLTVSDVILIAAIALLVYGWRKLLRACDAARVADWGNRWFNRIDGLNRIWCRRFHGLDHKLLELPATGGALVASNHVSGLDPLLIIAASPRPLRFLIAREEYDRWWLRWLFRAAGCIPVERTRNPRAALYAACEALARGEVVALFPHGRIHLDHHPSTPLKRGVVLMARMAKVPIYPVRVEGVRGQGMTVAAVFIRSCARVRGFAPLQCGARPVDDCLEELWDSLSVQGRQDNPHRQGPVRQPDAAD